ncbi:3-oxoacyl-[acyl-carrier protein] reductase [Vulgatibacter incomptus]|uniref:3-oxoacyl-[acyl-carrier protein] reductase n=1 Tax=Vulgatibacter incomptus TaxID=1391653 RepID=A0A0K1P8Z8_9BACT|nr:3-oxoacyl-[acyl-carrier protein] reductase [Vulgatibacter incomptus]
MITGASSGIGEAFARALATRGMHLVLAARREERLLALADALAKAHGVETRVVPVDLRQPFGPATLWREAGRDREIHLLVNNAGFGLQGRFEDLPTERQLDLVRLNVNAVVELTALFLPAMQDRGEGGVINVSSAVAFQPVPLMAAYAASKAFVLSFSEALWSENLDLGVRVQALCPGGSPTEFQAVAGTRLPGLGVLPAAAIVEQSLHGLEGGRSVVVPGLANKGAPFAARILPRELMARAAQLFVEKLK